MDSSHLASFDLSNFPFAVWLKYNTPWNFPPAESRDFAAPAKIMQAAHDCSVRVPVYDRANINDNASQGELS